MWLEPLIRVLEVRGSTADTETSYIYWGFSGVSQFLEVNAGVS
jgi:hypothetical protein